MATKRITITTHGKTIYVQAGKYKESFDYEFLSKDAIIDRVFWIGFTGGVAMSWDTVAELLRENRVIP